MPSGLSHALRSLRKTPGFSVSVLVILSLGIACNLVVFTVTSALLLKPLPFRDPHRLVLLDAVKKEDGGSNGFTLNRYELFRDNSHTLSGIAVAAVESMNLSGIGEPQQVSVARVSGNFFDVLGSKMQMGRNFTVDDAQSGSAPVVIISNEIWQNRFARDRHVLGRTLNLDGVQETVVGVLPQSARFPFLPPAEVWIPRYFELTLFTTERLRRGVGYLTAFARIAPGSTLDSVQSEMNVLHQRYSEVNPTAPDQGNEFQVKVNDLQKLSAGDVGLRLKLFSGAVLLLLLIAIANAGGLILSRAVVRRQQIAIRAALGASRARLTLDMLAEALWLAVGAGILGLLLSYMTLRLIASVLVAQFPGTDFGVDWRVAAFALVLIALSALASGLVPAIRLSRLDLVPVLRVEGSGSTPASRHLWYGNALVVGQITLSIILLISATALMRSFVRLQQSDAGFEPGRLVSLNIALPTVKYGTPQKQVAFFNNLLQNVSAVPGVESAAISSTVPLVTKRLTPVLPEGQPEVPLPQRPIISMEMISPRWFQTLGAPMLGGRDFSDADNSDSPKVIVVNKAFAQRFWPGANPIGRHVALGRQAPAEIVGVSSDVKNNGIATPAQPEIYIPYAQLPWSNMNLLVRAKPGLVVTSLLPALRAQVLSTDPEQAVSSPQTGEDLTDSSRAQFRYTGNLITVFGAISLILTSLGIYALLSYSVARRRRELAIRMAIGATPKAVVRVVLRQALFLVLLGAVLGVFGAALGLRSIATLLFGLGHYDPLSFVLPLLVFLAVAWLAVATPARRAGRISPLEAMR